MLDDDNKLYYKYLVRNFESCPADNVANIVENSFSGQVPGTKEQITQKHGYRSVVFVLQHQFVKMLF